jgi:sec-independent protein translocase protein TatA
MPGIGELLVVLLIVVLFFGASRIPAVGRSFGEAVKAFKKGKSEDK